MDWTDKIEAWVVWAPWAAVNGYPLTAMAFHAGMWLRVEAVPLEIAG